jgi:hypothetical protein
MHINDLLNNLKSHFRVSTDNELAACFRTSHQVVASWRKRGRIPTGKLMEQFPDIPWRDLLHSEGAEKTVPSRDLELEVAHLKGEVAALERQLDRHSSRIEEALRRCEEQTTQKKTHDLHRVS